MRTAAFKIVFIAGLVTFYGWGAGITNPGFESYTFDQTLDFNIPTGWQRENYTAAVQRFIPQPKQGSTENWNIDPEQGLTPFEGDSFVVVSNGSIDPDPDRGRLWQQVIFAPGEKLSGAYFFGTADYEPYDDHGTIKLLAESGSGLSDIEIVSISVSDVGDYSSTAGWVYFESPVFTELTAGTYTVEIGVYDFANRYYESYLAVDGLVLVPEPATLFLLGLGTAVMRKQRCNPSF